VIPDYPNITPPQAYMSISKHGGLVVPVPQYQRKDIQEPTIREAEIPPKEYYPKEYTPGLMQDWPTDKEIFIPEDQVPRGMKRRMKK
ncbi:MAG TPA: hypothetical protein VLM43_20805, partial [Desulfobacterales bacterium]|nr:hypothetical protein [Desulfobacterales bacterium]